MDRGERRLGAGEEEGTREKKHEMRVGAMEEYMGDLDNRRGGQKVERQGGKRGEDERRYTNGELGKEEKRKENGRREGGREMHVKGEKKESRGRERQKGMRKDAGGR